MSKNMIYGAGVLGIIAAAVYIYKEHKKAKETEAEAESVVNLDSEETEDTTKEQKKEVITEKVTSLGRKIGKTLGTAALKFGAKHPKITKFILKFGHYTPYALIGIAVINSFVIKWKVSHMDDTIDGSDMNYEMEVNDERLGGPAHITTCDVDPQKALEVWENSELSSNYLKLYDLLKTMNIGYSEQYIINNKQAYADKHPEYDFSDVEDNFVIRQKYKVQDYLDHNQQQ